MYRDYKSRHFGDYRAKVWSGEEAAIREIIK